MLSRKILCCILTEINPKFWSRSSPFLTKTDSYRSTNHKNLQKHNNEDFFIQLLYAWSPITTSLLISIEEILVQPISLNPHTRLNFKHHPTQEYFRQIYHIWDLCRLLQPGLISSKIFCRKLDFPTVNHHNKYIKLHWAQFPMIGKTYLEMKLPKNLL